MSVARGGMALIAAQAWHAITGWIIFRTATEVLGDSGYGAFTTVLWTMTTLEVLVTEGVPRAMALGIAGQPGATRATLRRALPATFAVAAGLCVLLALAAPLLTAAWHAEDLASAVRISGLDFLTFAAFAVFAALANGLRDFKAQARVQFAYSTAKVLIVVGALIHFRSQEGAMLGYVMASGLGSVGAILLTRKLPRASSVAHSALDFRHAWPLGLQSALLALLINVDLWIGATIGGAEDFRFGLYGMAATLCHSVYFVLRALGEALLPAVAHARGQQDAAAVRRATADGLGLLLILLAMALGCGLAASEALMPLLFGASHHGQAAVFVKWLLPAAASFTLLSVFAALLSGAGRTGLALTLLVLVASADLIACWCAAGAGGLEAVAAASLATGLAGVVLGAVGVQRILGALVAPRAVALALLVGVGNWALLNALALKGWSVVAVGGVVGLVSVAGAASLLRRSRAAHP